MAGAAFIAEKPEATLDKIGLSLSSGRRGSSGGLGLGRAVGDAAQELARSSQIAGVSEVAAAVSILVSLLTDNRDNKKSTDASLKRCRTIKVG